MTEDRKPINPLERRETIGVEDGDRHRGEAVTPPAPKAVPGETPER